jgi:Protein of unknown function (DUF4038)/Putative collagen-binding domain of a collagenase
VVDDLDLRRLRLAVASAALVAAALTACTAPLKVQHSGPGGGGPTTSGAPAPTWPSTSDKRWPSSIAGRKILDQNGRVYLMRTFSSWAMAMKLTDAGITQALEGVANRGFNAVTVWAGGGYDVGNGWNRYVTAEHGTWWAGTPWASDLGPGWAAMDRVMDEALRLGLTVNFSFAGGNGPTGARGDWEASTDQKMYDVGVAIATRYKAYPNIVWHVMFDDSTGAYSRINALFHGINDTEGASTRPLRWAEPNNLSSIYSQLIAPNVAPEFELSLNGFYNNWSSAPGGSSTELVEASWNESGATAMPTGDVEPGYDASPLVGDDRGQQVRERSYAVFLEGGVYINYGHEDWWPYGAQGVVNSTEDLTWDQVPDHVHTVQQQYLFQLLDQYVADPTWGPENGSFLTNGTGSGDSKAAAGRSDTAAIAYFPSERSVVVNTTGIGGTGPVRLRWYDPTAGAYTDISASEAQQGNRAVQYPPAHADGTNDWVLVVDRAI